METPKKSKSIMCVVDNWSNELSVDYYVSDEKKFSEVDKRFDKKENKWRLGKNVGNLRNNIKPFCRSKVGLNASYIVFNSCLYRIGGIKDSEGSSRVDYLDLNTMEKEWINISNMNHQRVNPYPVILDGQLYVVGGLYRDFEGYPAVLMEVLNKNGKWEDIPNPPPFPVVPPFPGFPSPSPSPIPKPKDEGDSSSNESEDLYEVGEEKEEEIYAKEYVEVKEKKQYEVEFSAEDEKEREEYFSKLECVVCGSEEEEEEICAEEEEKELSPEDQEELDNYYAEQARMQKECLDRLYFREVYCYAIVGVVKVNGKDVIIVGVDTSHTHSGSYVLYIYEAGKNEWEIYSKIDITRLNSLPEKTAVVSGQLMLFIAGSEIGYGGSEYLYVLDFAKEKLHVFNLFENIPDLNYNLCQSSFLVMIEEDKFDVFWEIKGTKSISTVVSSRFILKRNLSSMLPWTIFSSKTNTGLSISVTKKLNRFALIRDLMDHTLKDVVCML